MSSHQWAKPVSLFAALSLMLSGCTLAPDYTRPQLPVPNHYRGEQSSSSSDQQVSDIGWKTYFSDPDIQQLISTALQNNRNLRVSMLNVEKAAANYRIQDANLYPELDANMSSLGQRTPAGSEQNQTSHAITSHDYSANVGISSWEIDFFGRLRSLKSEALNDYLSQVATLRSARLSLVAEVAQGYLTLAADQSLLHVSQQTADNQRATLNLQRIELANGSTDEQTIDQMEIALQEANASVAQYQRAVDQAVNSLQLLLGAPVPESIINSARLENIHDFQSLPAGTPSSLLTQRPDIVAAEDRLKASNADIGAARAAFFPSISLTTTAGSASGSLDHLFAGGHGAWTFEPSLNLPIFDWGRREAQLDVSKIQKRSDIASYEQVIQQAFREVSDALAARSTYHDELAAREQDEIASQHYYDLAQLRYHEGLDSSLNALVAERSLFSSQQTVLATRLSSLNQQITLYKVLGGGWKE